MAAQISFIRERIANFCNEILVPINLPPRLRNIFDPLEETPYKWTLVWVSIISTLLDPMFFYIFLVNDHNKCLRLDTNLMIAVCLLRFLVDSCHLIFIFYHERRRRIFFVVLDVLCILPVPQVVTLIINRARGSEFIDAVKWLKYTIIAQYLLKLVRICKLYVEAERAPGIPVEVIKWLNAASCFFIYLLPGHVFGGLWYLMAIERETNCWNEACLYYHRRSCGSLHCDDHSSGHYKFLSTYCTKIIRDTTIYDFGIFQDALQSGIVEETKFTPKLFYCLRWGLLTTSSMAQNLRASTDVEENLFVILIYLTSFILIVLVLGRLQIYLQSGTQRLEERRSRARELRQWGTFRMLPENLQREVYANYQRFGPEHYLNDLPEHLRSQITRELCLEVVRAVPQFEGMEEQFLNEMCNRLQPVLYARRSYIVRQDELIRQMLFVMQGSLSTCMNGGGIVFTAGAYWGEELPIWALDPDPFSPLPLSLTNLCAFTKVEAFALVAEDLREVVQESLNARAGHP